MQGVKYRLECEVKDMTELYNILYVNIMNGIQMLGECIIA